MPYIHPKARQGRRLFFASQVRPITPGELTYAIALLVKNFLGGARSFEDYCLAIGSLEAAKLELYRAQVGPYEETKRQEHGDV